MFNFSYNRNRSAKHAGNEHAAIQPLSVIPRSPSNRKLHMSSLLSAANSFNGKTPQNITGCRKTATRTPNFHERLFTIALRGHTDANEDSLSKLPPAHGHAERGTTGFTLHVEPPSDVSDGTSCAPAPRRRRKSDLEPGTTRIGLHEFIKELDDSMTAVAKADSWQEDAVHNLADRYKSEQATSRFAEHDGRTLEDPYSSMTTSIADDIEYTDEDDDYTCLQLSDVCNTTSGTLPEIPQQVRLIFLAHLLYAFYHPSSPAPTTYAPGPNRSNSTRSERAQSQATNGLTPSYNKRKHTDLVDESRDQEREDQEQDPLQPRPPISRNTSDKSACFWACPFQKRFPLQHSSCQKRQLDGISRVKQHIKRAHQIPVHCSSCNTIFKAESELVAHVRRRPPCEVEPPKTWPSAVTPEQFRLIMDNRSNRKLTPVQQWYAIFETVFPGVQPPDSPYQDVLDLQQLETLRGFIQQEWPTIYERLAPMHFSQEIIGQTHETLLGELMFSMLQTVFGILSQQPSTPRSEAACTVSDSGYASQPHNRRRSLPTLEFQQTQQSFQQMQLPPSQPQQQLHQLRAFESSQLPQTGPLHGIGGEAVLGAGYSFSNPSIAVADWSRDDWLQFGQSLGPIDDGSGNAEGANAPGKGGPF